MYCLRQICGFIYFGLALLFISFANGHGINMDLSPNKTNFQILKAVLRELESSGGINKDHKKITYGIHEGHTAVGEFGLMPNTAREVVKLKKNKDSLDKILLGLPEDDLDEFFAANPKKYTEIVDLLINVVGERAQWDIPTAATMWRWGHNLQKERAQEILIKNPKYLNRIKAILNSMNTKEQK